MITWFKKFKRHYYPPATGLIIDPRLKEKQQEDFEAKEILKAVPVKWIPKKPEDFRYIPGYPVFHQDNSGSCVAQTIAQLLGVENYLEEKKFVCYSARDIYSSRKNFPNPGMWTQNGMEIGYKQGASLEQLMLSQKLNEKEMNKSIDRKTIDEQMALIGKGGNYLKVSLRNFDEVAQILKTGKAVTIGARFNPGDWRTGEVITRMKGSYGHLVTGLDFGLWKGKRALFFKNSWGSEWGFKGWGVITEDRIAGLHPFSYYFQVLKNTWRDSDAVVPKPRFNFKHNLVYGSRTLEVEKLQEALKFLELFPQNTISTGMYLNITASAVMKFQIKYKVASIEELNFLRGRRVGSKTRKVLNEIFA